MATKQPQQIEQFEVIEHTIEVGRRPITSIEAQSYQQQHQLRSSTEHFTNTGIDSADQRFNLTNERDAGHDQSFLFNPAQTSFAQEPPLQQSTPERINTSGSAINNFGYDLHEVHTIEGGARILQTHGSGHFLNGSGNQEMHDRSIDMVVHATPDRSPASISMQPKVQGVQFGGVQHDLSGQPDQPQSLKTHSILKSTWRQAIPSPEDTFARKDSYRRMQEGQTEHASVYEPSSNASKKSEQKWKRSKGLWSRITEAYNDSFSHIRESRWNPRLIVAYLLIALFIFLLLVASWFVFSSLFISSSVYTFLLYPPICEECIRRNPSVSTYRPPSKLYVHVKSPAQAHFELTGNQPFKSNSFTAVDFDTGFVAITDHALTDQQGRHTTCFIMQLDRNALPDMSSLKDALKNTYYEVRTQFGWQEYWQWNVDPVDSSFVSAKFKDEIEDCKGVKWYLLKHAVYTKDSSCSDCYDFCLPDFAMQRRQKYEDEVSIAIRRLNCFRLYVPEWSRFPTQTDSTGGHTIYPHPPQSTQRDENGNWINWNPTLLQQQNQLDARRRSITQNKT